MDPLVSSVFSAQYYRLKEEALAQRLALNEAVATEQWGEAYRILGKLTRSVAEARWLVDLQRLIERGRES